MDKQPDHATLLAAVEQLESKLDAHMAEVRPLVEITPDLKDWVEVMKAATVGRRFLLGLAALSGAIGIIFAGLASLKFALRAWLAGG